MTPVRAPADPGWQVVEDRHESNDLFELRSVELWAINAGYHTPAFTLFGVVFGLWH